MARRVPSGIYTVTMRGWRPGLFPSNLGNRVRVSALTPSVPCSRQISHFTVQNIEEWFPCLGAFGRGLRQCGPLCPGVGWCCLARLGCARVGNKHYRKSWSPCRLPRWGCGQGRKTPPPPECFLVRPRAWGGGGPCGGICDMAMTVKVHDPAGSRTLSRVGMVST